MRIILYFAVIPIILIQFLPPFIVAFYFAFALFMYYVAMKKDGNNQESSQRSNIDGANIIIDIPIHPDYLPQFKEYVVVDLETTGLSKDSNEIIEYAAVRYKDGHQVDYIQSLVNPHVEVPRNITNLTGITQSMISNAPDIEEALPILLDYIGDSIIIAHNASFDVGFIEASAQRHLNLNLDLKYTDTLRHFRNAFPQLPNHKLATVAKYLGIEETQYHRALADAMVTAKCFQFLLDNSFSKISYKVSKPNPSRIISVRIDLVNALSASIQKTIKDTPQNDKLEYEYDESMEKYAVKSSVGKIGYLPKFYNEIIANTSHFEISAMETHTNEKQKLIVAVTLNYMSLR